MNQEKPAANRETNKPNSFEDNFARLEAVVRQLESGQLTLDRSVELFEEGMSLSKKCSEMLNQAELRISKLRTDYGLPAIDPNNSSTPANPAASENEDLEKLPW